MQRRHDLDWIRVCAFGLLVLYHVGMYYVSWDWHVKSPHAGPALEPLMLLSSPWRLSLLFLVSGVATAYLLDRAEQAAHAGSGRVRFLGARSWRLLVPLAFGMLVVVPPQSYYEVVEQLPGGWQAGYAVFYARYLSAYDGFCDADGCLILPTWNHLWFVAYLWVYTVALWLLWQWARPLLERTRSLLVPALRGWGVLLWPALALGLARMLLVERFGSTHALVGDWYNHVQYFGVFLLGFLIARAPAAWDALVRVRWTALALWLAAWAALVGYFAAYADLAPLPWVRLAMRAAWGLDQWCAIVAVLGFARRLAPGDSPALRYLSAAVFPVYILHQTVIVVLAHHLKPLDLPPALEGPLLVLATFALCLAAYTVIRRFGWLRPLFGLKRLPSPAKTAKRTADGSRARANDEAPAGEEAIRPVRDAR
ncbi:acetyltransferase [Pseudoxanthomonas broegbernensis]|uniref:Acetyltransferase n=1 Tax=Pseudoxanthomonas broegbernensis TaxID=83619 RepID=A0A7V8K841_9GAMM|nr:acyltransferase family protein [Pseudoxanthomonas broegbernensis]KAF1687649.1 acetyltransferase [Pseudoxanthomonas broegbernensis]MBB6064675.1 peptidoglycan/LPS O-acetylase OafA/YrhL [Pseudoxanthomonas broegbernensis]